MVKQRKLDKLTPPYDPDPYVVIEKKGSMVTADRDGHTINRNSSQFRPVKVERSLLDEKFESGPSVPQEVPCVDDPYGQVPAAQSALSPVNPIPAPVTPVPSRRNPPRSAGMPKRYADFEIG